jgi:hypothetical protein
MYLGEQLKTFYGYVATLVGEVATFSGYNTAFGGNFLRHF